MNPVKGSYRRYALVQPRDAQNCTVLAAYQGWRRAWQAKAGGRSYFVDFASYTGGLLVTRVDTPGSPNRLVAYNEMTGKIRWRWQCPDRDPAYFSTATYHGMNDALEE